MDRRNLGELAIVLSMVLLAVAAVMVKTVTDTNTGAYAAFLRFMVGIVLGALFFTFSGRRLMAFDRRYLIARGFFGATAMILFYVAIETTSSGRAMLLNLTYPLWVAVIGYALYSNKITTRNVAAIMLGLAGILLVFYDGTSYPLAGNLTGLASGLSAGFAIHFIKKSRKRNDPVVVYMAACVFGLLFTSPSSTEAVAAPDALILLAAGVLAFLGQIAMTYGYKYVTATRGAVISFSVIPVTIALSIAFIGEEVTARFIAGTIVIICALLVNRT